MAPSSFEPSLPTIRVSRRAAERLRAGHLWVYRSDVESIGAVEPATGALVSVQGGRGTLSSNSLGNSPGSSPGNSLGTALWSSASQIAARMVSREPALDRPGYLRDVRERLCRAVRLRAELAPVDEANNAQRLVFSEADGLPGIVADRYNDLVLLQLLTQGTAQADVREVIHDVFAEEANGSGRELTVWERPDPRIRQMEQLEEPPAGPLFTTSAAEAPTLTTFRLNGLTFGYDASAGQKTGAFLDQRLNYAAAATWAERLLRASGRPGRALDVCTYQGGFALHLAQVCERVTGVDASRAALEAADRNLALNEDLQSSIDWVEADAFELLRAMDEAAGQGTTSSAGAPAAALLPAGLGGRFDVIVLDPPAFAKTKRAVDGALRGYKELNLRALRLLESGGLLVTCSCSHHVSETEFREAVYAAAVDAGRSVQVLESRGAAPDHPEIVTLPETRYLKCLICRVA